ncbi:MAG TPA: polyphosphate polymerase domain-containing protein [Vicinamibacterales bacterium]|nr:polyphosphate polymerase domain-containing protein [Vicinamibacterales bacterium]
MLPALMRGFDSRETRDFARETKFLVDAKRLEDVRAWAREHLGRDPHGTGEHGDLYATTSLYFDTAAFDVYRRNSSHARGKFRIRRYGLLDFIFLERKMRTDRILAKRRTTVPLEALQKIADPQPDPTWPGFWFHRRLLIRGLLPMVQISYDRTARLSIVEGDPVRFTIDTNLRVLPMPDRAFIPGAGFPVIEDKAIVEMKYRREPPALLRRAIETFKLTPVAISKYRLGSDALGQVTQQQNAMES